MRYTTCESEGEALVVVNTAIWEAVMVLSNNANMIRLKHIPSGWDVLRSPESLAKLRERPECYGMPILFPPGRIDRGRFRVLGRDYSLPINEEDKQCNLHGLLLGDAWTLDEVEEGKSDITVRMSIQFDATHQHYAGFPHEFKITLTYRFAVDSVFQEVTVENHSVFPMPCGFGFHTAFQIPNTGATLYATIADQRYEASPDRRLPTGRLLDLREDEMFNYVNGGGIAYNSVAMICPAVTKNGFRGARILIPDGNIEVLYEVSTLFRFFALWNDCGGKGFVCVEPVTWLSNAPNLSLPHSETGMMFLAPREKIRETCRLAVHHQAPRGECVDP